MDAVFRLSMRYNGYTHLLLKDLGRDGIGNSS